MELPLAACAQALARIGEGCWSAASLMLLSKRLASSACCELQMIPSTKADGDCVRGVFPLTGVAGAGSGNVSTIFPLWQAASLRVCHPFGTAPLTFSLEVCHACMGRQRLRRRVLPPLAHYQRPTVCRGRLAPGLDPRLAPAAPVALEHPAPEPRAPGPQDLAPEPLAPPPAAPEFGSK